MVIEQDFSIVYIGMVWYGMVCYSAHSLGAFQWPITSSITLTFNLN